MSHVFVPARSAAALLLLGALSVGGALLVDGAPAYAEDANVSATGNNVFDPNRVAVLVGDTVTWSTTGGVNHTVTSSSANWKKDSSIQLVGQSTTFTFSRAGTYTYYCKTHGAPASGMRGTVVVSNPPRPAPSPTKTTAKPSPTPKPTATPRPSTSPTLRPSPSRTPTARPSVSPTSRPSAPPSGSPSTRPTVPPTVRPPTVRPRPSTPVSVPTLAGEDDSSPEPTVELGSGGLGPRASTGRGRGLPTFLALIALGGVVSAQVRALLAVPTES